MRYRELVNRLPASWDILSEDAGLHIEPLDVPPPKNTVRAYKLFRIDPKRPGQLFPLYVNADKPIPIGKWVEAEIGPMVGDKVKSKLGPLAFRPGWHAGDLPIATHIGGKSDPKLRRPDHRLPTHVWAEVELPADVDWQSEANRRAKRDKTGKIIPRTAHITDQIPHGGHYRYRTNPNMTGNWLIAGAMKVVRVLSDAEVEAINREAGVADLPRLEPSYWTYTEDPSGDAPPPAKSAAGTGRRKQPTVPAPEPKKSG